MPYQHSRGFHMSELYIGLMSGTSADGIDVVLVNFSDKPPSLVASYYVAYPQALRTKILNLCRPGENEIERLGELDAILGKAFGLAVNALLEEQAIPSSSIQAIGSHGQTIRHQPHQAKRFTLQIGDPNIIAAETGITTVADFRRKDMALGGEGAPLVPAFHQEVFASEKSDRAVVNIGGIANVTILPQKKQNSLVGFDTGPGNVLMDAWIYQQLQKPHDVSGEWAATGTVQANLLQKFLADPFFAAPAPKSTGREYFNLDWINKILENCDEQFRPEDVQATLAELTATSILDAIRKNLIKGDILICGGGTQNTYLMSRLQTLASSHFNVRSTDEFGIHPDWVEAIAFAWLARQTINKLPGNVPSVTGAKRASVLGGVYLA